MKKMFSILDKLMEWVAFVSIAGFTFLVFLQVVCRYVLNSPLHWQEEICVYLLYLVVLSGAIQAVKNGSHISVDFISQKISPQKQQLLKMITYSLVFVCCLFLTYSGALYCTSVGNRRSSELRIMMKYIYTLLPVAGMLMSIYSLREAVRAGRRFFHRGGDDECC